MILDAAAVLAGWTRVEDGGHCPLRLCQSPRGTEDVAPPLGSLWAKSDPLPLLAACSSHPSSYRAGEERTAFCRGIRPQPPPQAIPPVQGQPLGWYALQGTWDSPLSPVCSNPALRPDPSLVYGVKEVHSLTPKWSSWSWPSLSPRNPPSHSPLPPTCPSKFSLNPHLQSHHWLPDPLGLPTLSSLLHQTVFPAFSGQVQISPQSF